MSGPYYATPPVVDSRDAVSAPTRPRALAGAALLVVVAGGLFTFDLGGYPLWDTDEARHAEVARELAAGSGVRRLFLPTLELEPYREKPAGYYWLAALAYTAAGVGAGAARAPSALAALLVVLAAYAWALPRHGVRGALGAGLVLATSVGWFGLARYASLDMTLSACAAIAVLAGLAWLERPPPRRPPLAPYVGAALGTLVKGPIGAVLVGLPLGVAALLHRPRPGWRELGLARGLAVAGVIVALLYVPVAVLDPSYLTAFLATNVRRFGTRAPHTAPPYYYLVWLPVLCLPWVLFAVAPLQRAARDRRGRMLLAWAASIPAFLTLAHGKLAAYALSAMVPVALLVGPALAVPTADDRPVWRAVGWILVATLVVVGLAAPLAAPAYPVSAGRRALLATAALVWAVALAAALRRDRTPVVPAVVLGAVLTLYLLVVGCVAPAVSALHSDRDAARLIAAQGPAPVIAFAARAPSLVFYLGAPVIRTDDPQLVRDLFTGGGLTLLITGRRHFAEIEQLLGDRAHRWHTTPRRRLYGNRPPPDS